MYPGTIINWYDQSDLNQYREPAVIDNKPLFMVVSSFDKGTEDLVEISGTDFNKMYGTVSFEKHGQNGIQAQRIIDAGGKLLVKRVVAKDATIANVVFTVTVKDTETQKTDEEGNLLYIDPDGNETTEAFHIVTSTNPGTGDGEGGDEGSLEEAEENLPATVTSSSIKWEASSITGCRSIKEVREGALELLDEESGVYPLIIFTDNGCGKSSKAIRLIPDYNTSKGIGKMFYTAAVFEGTNNIENQPVTLDPDVIYGDVAYGLDKNTCMQLNCMLLEDVYDVYVNRVAQCLGVDIDDAKNLDLIYGYDTRGSLVSGISVDAESIDMNATFGVELKEGYNGEFGDKPVNTDPWVDAIRAVYAGEVTDEVWDVDQHKIHAICDANLPFILKEAIAEFAAFRKDCMFFRDLGVGLTTFSEIRDAKGKNKVNSRFVSDFCTSYQVKDPNTKRNIEVTCMYDFVECLVNHFDAGAHNPLAGTLNGFILRNAIKGTINYTPIISPTVNQKQAMEDLRVNYAIFNDDNCVVQTLYTSQDAYTQLSYSNNVLAIQEVIRAVRTACPKNRYALVNGSDMSSYAKAVNNVLSKFASNFDILDFKFTQDKLKSHQKIFYASIYFAFHNWAQTEIFDIFAINNI